MRKLLLIVNPASGNGKAIKVLPYVKSYLNLHSDKIEIDYKVSRYPKDISNIAKEHYDNGYREFLVIGGDGSISELLNGLKIEENSDIKIGIMPYGSGNDFSKSLYNKFEINTLLKKIVEDQTITIDLGKVNDFIFINSCSFGIDGPIIRQTDLLKKHMNGKIAYYLSTLKEGVRFKPTKVKLSYNGINVIGNKTMVTVCNGKYFGGGMMIAPDAKLDDHYLDLCIIDEVSKIKFIRNIKKVYSGDLDQLEEVNYDKITSLSIESKEAYDINIDGTLVGKTPANIKIIKNAIKVFN